MYPCFKILPATPFQEQWRVALGWAALGWRGFGAGVWVYLRPEHVDTCIYIYTCTCIYISARSCMYIHAYICMYVCMYMYLHNLYIYREIYIYLYVYVFIHVYVCVYTYIYIYIYVHICTCVYVCMCVCMVKHTPHHPSQCTIWSLEKYVRSPISGASFSFGSFRAALSHNTRFVWLLEALAFTGTKPHLL